MATEQIMHSSSGWTINQLRPPTKWEGLLALALLLLGLPIAVALATTVLSIAGTGVVGILGGTITVFVTLGLTWLVFAIGFQLGSM